MSLFNILATLMTVAALLSYLNYRYLRLPTTIGLMVISLLFSLGLIVLDHFGVALAPQARELMLNIDFNETLMNGMLSFLLFAGALHVNINDLARQKWIILSLATVGVLISAFIVGGLSWWILGRLHVEMPFIYCLLFGALISPTDPIAVMGILKTAGAPKSLETKITGESLFNDGIAVVLFILLLGIATGHEEPTLSGISWLFLQEAVGGVLFGLAIGYVAYRMLKSVDNYQVEILITLALVTGGYALANALHISGPIAIVLAGLLIGNHGRMFAMSSKTSEHLDTFWELIDEILNAILFVLIGLEILVLTISTQYLLAGILLIPAVLLARFISVGLPVTLMSLRQEFTRNAITIMTWGGLRGGISIALALSLPRGGERDIVLTITYVIVVFSIVVQGLTIGKLVKRSSGAEEG